MTIPLITTPKFNTTLPSNGKTVTFRPFLVKEQKNLLIASQGKDPREIVNCVLDIVASCVDDVNVNDMPYFDVQWLFLQLRAKSVGEIISLNVKHREGDCRHIHKEEIDINQLKFEKNSAHTKRIMITDKIGVTMRYPNLHDIEQLPEKTPAEQAIKMVAINIENIFDETNIYDQFSLQEAEQFVESLTTQQIEKVSEFFNTIPKLVHVIDWTCPKCGKNEHVEIEGLQNFF